MADNFEDMREFKRIPLTTKMRFRKMDLTGESEHVIDKVVTNISGGGIFIPGEVKYAKGSLLQLEFRIPSRAEKVVVMAKVMWVGDTGMGVEFLKIDARVRADIVKNAKRGAWVDSSPELPTVKTRPTTEGDAPPDSAAEPSAATPAEGIPSLEPPAEDFPPPPPDEPRSNDKDALSP